MVVSWTSKALSDLARLYEFLAPANRTVAARTIQTLTAAPLRLAEQPRLGEKLDEFDPRNVRRIQVGHYEIRYEPHPSALFVLRIWHTREHR
jgi:plasmid stabilization system protein ParE